MRWSLALGLVLACTTGALASPELAVCGADQATWKPARLPGASEPDLRFLADAPAGKHGFVQSRGESFVFEDGTPVRFWGTNVAADALFESSDAAIDAHALRLAKLGFNLVRLHHHDSGGWVERNARSNEPGVLLNPIAMKKLDRWIARLKEQGIYVWLDLHTGRVFRESEQIPGFDELIRASKQGPKAKGFLYLNPRLEQLVLEFAEAYLGHRNELTRLRYREDPAIAAVLVTNENDLSHHFGNLFVEHKRNNPRHRARLLAAAAEFAKRSELPAEQLDRTWEPGPAKLLLAQLEHELDARMRARLREVGVRVPIALTSYWGRSGLWALAALSRGEMIDVHTYAAGDPLRVDPRTGIGYLGWIAAGQLAGKPVSVSEWGHGTPLQRDRFLSPLWTAGVSALQDWDAPLLYAYSQRELDRPAPRLWSAAFDPATIALMPASALLFRRGDVAAARKRVVVTPSREDLFFRRGYPATAFAIPTLLEQHRVSLALPAVKELPWLAPPAVGSRAERVSDLTRSFLPADATRVRSDTGQLERDFTRGVLRIDTPRSQAAVGALAGETIALSHARIAAETRAAVAFTSLDGKPLDRSQRILVSVAARACAKRKIRGWLAEPVRGKAWLTLRGNYSLTPLDSGGAAIALVREEQGVALPLDFGGSWALIEPKRAEAR